MKRTIWQKLNPGGLQLILLLLISLASGAQVTAPIIKAGFGVDADLRANIFNGAFLTGNDDWYRNGSGTGRQVIDTNGAAAIYARYSTDLAFRRQPFYRKMAVEQYSAINGRLWIDALMVRDHRGTDSSAFTASNKNGSNPKVWNGGVSPVPDKNDIGDIFAHVRRAGTTITDSLWFLGGLSLMGTTGNRYFDFELYQTDLIYDMTSSKFTNYGPDSGHTAWQFDAAGNVVRPGDIIFTAEFGTSGLSFIEARIWIRGSDTLTTTPNRFNWAQGKYDGDNDMMFPTFGYKSILPKTTGDFYTGTQVNTSNWAGPFGFINASNGLQTTLAANQFMEFSVNLTKLGLDPIDVLGSGSCNMPFSKIVVKTRTSTSFTSELKDFVGPFSLFAPAHALAAGSLPMMCPGGNNVGDVFVTNPLSTSLYNWTTDDGSIVSGATGPSIQVNEPGTYVVTQRLYSGCSPLTTDTVVITQSAPSSCIILSSGTPVLKGAISGREAVLSWKSDDGHEAAYYELERSLDGISFRPLTRIAAGTAGASYTETDRLGIATDKYLYYRLRVQGKSGQVSYTNTVSLLAPGKGSGMQLSPNPAHDAIQLAVQAGTAQSTLVRLVDPSGRLVREVKVVLQKGSNLLRLDLHGLPKGIYGAVLLMDRQVFVERFVVQ